MIHGKGGENIRLFKRNKKIKNETDSISLNPTINDLNSFFNSYDISGLNSIQLSNNSILYNYLDTSKPLIKAYGGGVSTITVNGQSFVIDVGEYVYIDSALELTYKDKNTAGNLQVGEYPVLINGENLISWDSNITKLEIQPNWRCL